MSAPKLLAVADAEALAQAAAERFVRAGEQAQARGPEALFLACLSGGRTPLALFRLLADPAKPWRARLDWGRVALFWGDERWQPREHPENNAGAALKALQGLDIDPDHVHAWDTSLADPGAAAQAYESQLRSCFGLGAKAGAPRFDLLLLGLGADGHTASLFPGADLRFGPGQLCAGLQVPQLGAPRLSLTPLALSGSRETLFLVSGPDKAPALKKLLAGPGPDAPPACLVQPREGVFGVITDGGSK